MGGGNKCNKMIVLKKKKKKDKVTTRFQHVNSQSFSLGSLQISLTEVFLKKKNGIQCLLANCAVEVDGNPGRWPTYCKGQVRPACLLENGEISADSCSQTSYSLSLKLLKPACLPLSLLACSFFMKYFLLTDPTQGC